jgi:hypothetical protein
MSDPLRWSGPCVGLRSFGKSLVLAFLASVSLVSAPVFAGNIVADRAASTSGLGRFTGQIMVTNQRAMSALVTVTLTNTSPASNGGYITGFVLNDPATDLGGNIKGISNFTTTNSDFVLLGGPTLTQGISAAPFGSFAFGAALGGNWLGGGNPTGGIGVGESATFTFNVTGDHLENLSDTSLESAMSTGGALSAFFDVRFRGFDNSGSDKVPAAVNEIPIVPTPEPTTMTLSGSGLVLLLGYAWRKRRPVRAQQSS